MKIFLKIVIFLFAVSAFARPFPMQQAVSFAPKKMSEEQTKQAEERADVYLKKVVEAPAEKTDSAGAGQKPAGAAPSQTASKQIAAAPKDESKIPDGLNKGTLYLGIFEEKKDGASSLFAFVPVPEKFDDVCTAESYGLKIACVSKIFSDAEAKFVKLDLFFRSLEAPEKNFSYSARVQLSDRRFAVPVFSSAQLGELLPSKSANSEKFKCILFRP